MKILITGGHLSPALSVIEALPKNTDVLLVGRKYTFEGDTQPSFELQTAKARGIPFTPITTGRLQRPFTKHSIPSLLKLPLGFTQSLAIVHSYKPNVILCFGGYVSLPVAFAGKVFGVPIVLHEQTLGAGLANKIIGKFAQKICISWESSRRFFPADKVVLTGNPIKKFTVHSLPFTVDKKEKKLPLLYITGGSAGSHTINMVVEGCLGKLLEKYTIIHQTGDNFDFADFDRLQNTRNMLSEKQKARYMLTKFVNAHDVGAILQASDIVVGRSGMNTITELLYFGKTTLFIPLNNEQMTNAKFFVSQGLGTIVSQDALTPEKLVATIENMIAEKKQYDMHAHNAKKLILKNAALNILAVIYSVART